MNEVYVLKFRLEKNLGVFDEVVIFFMCLDI